MMKSEGISCDTVDIRLDQLTEKDCVKLSDLNVRGIFFGWESGSDRLLKLMRKGLTTELILNKVKMLSKFKNIPFWGSSIILLPTETLEETLQTIKFSNILRELLPNSTISVFRFMPLPQTDLTNIAIEQGFSLPSNPKEWKKIDPITRYYEASWIPWMDEKCDKIFRYVQEYSRNGIMSYAEGQSLVRAAIKNTIAKSMEKRFELLNFNLLIEPKIYEVLLKIYNLIHNTDYKMLKTDILD